MSPGFSDISLPPPSYNQATNAFSLSYVDFTPQLLEEGGVFSKPKYERFDCLMEKANAWLCRNPTVKARTCESIEVKFRSESQIDTNKSTYFEYGKTSMYFIRCLRMWIIPRESSEAPEPQRLGYFNAVPACTNEGGMFSEPKFASFGDTISQINEMFRQQPLPGKIINIETQDMKFSSWKGSCDPDRSCWMEYGDHTTYFLNVIRIFYEVGTPAYEDIGCADFVPDCLDPGGVFSHSKYQGLASVVEKAQAWLSAQRGVRLTNVQTLDYKISSSWSGDRLDTQRSLYREYGEARTRYLRIGRVCYVCPRGVPVSDSAPPVSCLTYRTFIPYQLTTGGAFSSAKYEGLCDTMKRAMAWLNHAGVGIICAETVPVRIYSGHQRGDPEVTYTWEPGERSEHIIFVLRVFMDGIPREPPPQLLPPPPQMTQENDCCTIV